LRKQNWRSSGKKTPLTTGMSPKTFTFGQNFGQQANLIFHFAVQRACQPSEITKKRGI